MRLWENKILFGPQLPKIMIIITSFYYVLTMCQAQRLGFSCIKKKIFTTALFGKYYYFPYFTIQKTETQEG